MVSENQRVDEKQRADVQSSRKFEGLSSEFEAHTVSDEQTDEDALEIRGDQQ